MLRRAVPRRERDELQELLRARMDAHERGERIVVAEMAEHLHKVFLKVLE